MRNLTGERLHRRGGSSSSPGLLLIAAGMWVRILARDATGGSPGYQAEEREYMLFMAEELDLPGIELTHAGQLLQAPHMDTATWRADEATEAEKVSASQHRTHARQGPGRFRDSNHVAGLAMAKYIDAMSLIEPALSANDEPLSTAPSRRPSKPAK